MAGMAGMAGIQKTDEPYSLQAVSEGRTLFPLKHYDIHAQVWLVVETGVMVVRNTLR